MIHSLNSSFHLLIVVLKNTGKSTTILAIQIFLLKLENGNKTRHSCHLPLAVAVNKIQDLLVNATTTRDAT